MKKKALLFLKLVIQIVLLYSGASLGKSSGIVILGDWGSGTTSQISVAKGLVNFCKSNPCDAVLTVGDNFYPKGVDSTTDSKWKSHFLSPFEGLKSPFFPTFGNHDYDGNIQAQLDFSQINPQWQFPNSYYHIQLPHSDLFALDTVKFKKKQRKWLENILNSSKSPWKIVYGHHPIRSYGHHGGKKKLITHLEPLLKKYHVQFYVSGHEHDKQFIRWNNGLSYLICGTGGADLRRTEKGLLSLFAKSSYGFCYLKLEPTIATVMILDAEGRSEYTHQIFK